MKPLVLSSLALLVLVAPASADSNRHHRKHRHGHHVVGTHPRHGEVGFPITAAKDSIRINAVGEVISQPVAVIEKERTFNDRAKRDLSTPPRTGIPSPQVSPSPQP